MSQSITSMDARTQPRIIPCNNGIGLYEIDETHETFDTLQEAKEALEKLKDARTQAEIDDEVLLEEHYNRKAGIYPEPEGDPSY